MAKMFDFKAARDTVRNAADDAAVESAESARLQAEAEAREARNRPKP